jgi:hypothetical protein
MYSSNLHDNTASRFRRRPKTARYRARTALEPGAPAHGLMAALGSSARLWTLTPAHLDLPDSYSDPASLYDAASMAHLRRAVALTFSGPLLYVFEVGRGDGSGRGLLHVHLIAHRDDGPADVLRDSERCKTVYDAPGLLTYLNKPPESYSPDAETDALAARVLSSARRLPQTRGYLRSAARYAWLEPAAAPERATNALSATFSKSTSERNKRARAKRQRLASNPAEKGSQHAQASLQPGAGATDTAAPDLRNGTAPRAAPEPHRHSDRRTASRRQRAHRETHVRARAAVRRYSVRLQLHVAHPARCPRQPHRAAQQVAVRSVRYAAPHPRPP